MSGLSSLTVPELAEKVLRVIPENSDVTALYVGERAAVRELARRAEENGDVIEVWKIANRHEARAKALAEALERIDAGWAAPPAHDPELIHWTQILARDALAAYRGENSEADA